MKMVTKELIEKFLKKECTIEEHRQVLIFLEKNPEVLDKYFDEEEWNNFIVPERLDEIVSEKLFENISNKTYRKKKASIVLRIVAAASVVIAIGLSVKLLMKSGIAPNNELKNTSIAQFKLIQRTNTTKKAIAITLEDSSIVELEPNSTVKFYEPLAVNNKRDIQLTGTASFKVAKNAAKPFTVYSGGVATSALGTQFSVAMNKNRLVVKLFEGKVVIKSTNELVQWKQKNIYLTPGMEFIYDSMSALYTVKSFKIPDSKKEEKAVSDNNDLSEKTKRANWYMFNNQPLAQVFKQLEEVYNIHIEYNDKDFEGVYFIGKFDKNDSVENVLENIVLLENLKLVRKGNTYIIEKK
jgi:ferric-dicitrate binding protein FerR (iron transport regulator)